MRYKPERSNENSFLKPEREESDEFDESDSPDGDSDF